VVSAGEDVVIEPGSTTYENVIDSGIDSILPDLAELGITTQTNQNPRTNLSGGFVISGVTQSQVNIVRNTAIFKSKFDTR
jgi:F0F1-type ATP synthase epsilon subunit